MQAIKVSTFGRLDGLSRGVTLMTDGGSAVLVRGRAYNDADVLSCDVGRRPWHVSHAVTRTFWWNDDASHNFRRSRK
jgi:hypothetical protein